MQKVNFTQLGLYGSRCDKTYRENFKKINFEAALFKLEMAKRFFEKSVGVKAIAIDPNYISKSGKHTPGVGYFWSGVAQSTKWELEILGIGIIVADRKECMMLEGVPTPNFSEMERIDTIINAEQKPNWFLVGAEAISDFNDIKKDLENETLDSIKHPYHKKADKERFSIEVKSAKKEKKFTLIDWYLYAIGGLPEEVFEYANIVVQMHISPRRIL